MVFSSITFLFYFLPIFLAAYFVTPTITGRNIVALYFATGFLRLGRAPVRLHSSHLDHLQFLRGACDRRAGRSVRRFACAVAVAGNLTLLGVFKYANFITGNLTTLITPLGRRRCRQTSRCRSGSRFHLPLPLLHHRRLPSTVQGQPQSGRHRPSIFPSFRNWSLTRSLAIRPSRANWVSAGSRSAAPRSATGSHASALPKRWVADVVAPLVQVTFDQVHDRR